MEKQNDKKDFTDDIKEAFDDIKDYIKNKLEIMCKGQAYEWK